ncbi:MAG: divalent metal cation transporter [Bacteroidota bacterium]
MSQAPTTSWKKRLKSLGPGLLFASTAIGTSHLVLSTQAGAHHGLIFIWIILATLILKYPFYEFGPRYANATGFSLLKGYKDQGKWAIFLYLSLVFISMFAVVGAIGAVSAGLLSSMYGMSEIPMPLLLGGILSLTAALLLIGRYKALDNFIKFISVVLFFTVLTAFVAVLLKGPVEAKADFVPNKHLFEGAALALMVSLVGWMPSGMETSTMNSIWVVNKMSATNYRPSLKESLFDFNLGYGFTVILALMFLVIGAFTVYGSGELLEGNATQFSNKLLAVFTTNLGDWSYPIIAAAAFGAIYGTLITAWDAFARSFARGLRALKFELEGPESSQAEAEAFMNRMYNIFLPLIGLGAFLLFTQFQKGMLAVLAFATTLSFLTAPLISFLNLRAIQSKAIPASHKPPQWMMVLAYIGLAAMTGFALYYLYDKFLTS